MWHWSATVLTVVSRRARFQEKLGYTVVELTGDFTPDIRALETASIVVTTPEKWDGVSRHWRKRRYVRRVGLVVIDEIHLLGLDRGMMGPHAPAPINAHPSI